jgi:hypothetical protein
MNSTNLAVSSSEPTLKRKRTDEPQNSDNEDDGIISKPPIRDERYYMDNEGADCVILAGKVLFKVRLLLLFSTWIIHLVHVQVHRFILSKDSSAFGNMFAMPAGHGNDGLVLPREGSSDENPIVLQEDPDQFRALLWSLYAL